MAYRAAILGGSGYLGAEVLRLLAGHPEIEAVHVTADANVGAKVGDLFPSLSCAYPMLEYSAVEPASLDGLDLVFVALPHGESQRVIPDLISRVAHVVDLGADFRHPEDTYIEWYGGKHSAPELLTKFGYGLPELYRDELAGVAHVAAPGCYPTTTALALAPLFANGLAEPNGVIVDAVSGVSGRGRGLSAPSLYSEANENVQAYGLLDHRHTGEIQQVLGKVATDDVQVLFTPHLVPMTRGILATCYARPAKRGLSTDALLALYREHYSDEPFVVVSDGLPATKATLGSNSCHVTVRYDERTNTLLALGALDNLVKGGSGQGIQAANLVLGLPETTGLPIVGMMP
ncbi:MAG: N-acetyl-gamma-glutamyl-phosphate reductase [Actinobacteria bacterium]|nr:N-acetyl-gamma-glutamyl-phosphate reductase [Actinomycetota bacterium]